MALGIERHYKDGKPWHVHSPNLSVWHVLSDTEFKEMSHSHVQLLFRKKCFVITGKQNTENDFKKALERAGSLRTVVKINGAYYPCFTMHACLT